MKLLYVSKPSSYCKQSQINLLSQENNLKMFKDVLSKLMWPEAEYSYSSEPTVNCVQVFKPELIKY